MAVGDTLCRWRPQDGIPPATTNFMTQDQRNQHPVLDADDTTNENINLADVMPQHYGGGNVDLRVGVTMTTAVTGDFDCDAAFERNTGLDIDGDSFAAVQSTDNTTVPGTSGVEMVITVSFTAGAQMDSVVAGDKFRLQITRDAASDTAAGDSEIVWAELREVA